MSRPIRIHELSALSEEEAWSLFKLMALKLGQVLNPSHEIIGMEIVAKCCGVPLAIRAIGGMMYSKDLESEWLLFKNEELSKIDVYKNDILPILKLSYNHLPSHYKHCFAYCILYPKDFEIPVEELIRQWMAHGYLKPTNSDESLRDVGFGYFMDLFRLSFFQDVEKDYFGNVETCKMHDLMHDLAISVAGNNFSTSLSEMTPIKDKTQHMSFWVNSDSTSEDGFTLQDFSPLLKAKKLRTVLPLAQYEFEIANIKKEEVDVFCNLRCLRVLSLSHFNFYALPSSIYKLKHLRNLDLSHNWGIKKLPDSITNLQNLQVLNLCWSTELMKLPNNITKLVNLTDLDNEACFELTHMPRGIGKLTRLEKLSIFVIAKDNSVFSKRSGGLDELYALNNLRRSLEIRNLGYLKNAAIEFKAANLNAKKKLQNLTLRWDDDDDDNNICSAHDISNDEMGLEALRPHQSLKGLSVCRYRGVRSPSWLPSLTNLVSVRFENCMNIQWLPPFDQLPYLESLRVSNLSKLERIDVGMNFEKGGSSSFFPSLTHLSLDKCRNLKGFVRCNKTSDVGSSMSMEELLCFLCLLELQIDGCPNLTYLPLFLEIKVLRLWRDGVKSVMEILKMATTSSSESTSPPFSTLSQLEILSISIMEDCPVDELLLYLPSLQKLEFYWGTCKSVSTDEKDDIMQWQSLKVLQSVEFYHMENLLCLPKGLQYVTTLQRLQIYHCDSLASIPEWMGNLMALQHLSINLCPKLSERCKNNTAEDWPKISHIPNIQIENKSIQRNGCYML